MGESYECHLEGRACIERLAHVDDRSPDRLEGANAAGSAERGRWVPGGRIRGGGRLRDRGRRRAAQLGCHRSEKHLPQPIHQLHRQPGGVEAGNRSGIDRLQGEPGVPLGDRRDQLTNPAAVVLHDAGCRYEVESRECVPRRAVCAPHRRFDSVGREVQVGVGGDVGEEGF